MAIIHKQREHLYRSQPNLYLHLFYRVPNQCLVASLDSLGTLQPGLLAAGDASLARLQSEETLRLSKRDHEITALAGTLCQLHTFFGRHRGERTHLRKAIDRGRLALEKARPFERGRDVNYWIHLSEFGCLLSPIPASLDPPIDCFPVLVAPVPLSASGVPGLGGAAAVPVGQVAAPCEAQQTGIK
jgi:hypothetical protein